MDLSLFKESISQHSANLKAKADDLEFNAVMVKASYYGEASIRHIDKAISVFKEKASLGVTPTLYREGLADIGKAIWTAIIKIAQAIVRVAVNVKMFLIGGEKGLIKRLEKVRAKLDAKDTESFTGAITVPILKGNKGLSGFHRLMMVTMDLVSGNAFLDASVGVNGELTWDYTKDDIHKARRMYMLKDIEGVIGNPKHLNLDTTDVTVREIPQDASLMDVISMPTRLVTVLHQGGDASASSWSQILGNDPDLDKMAKTIKYMKSGISKKGIAPQLINNIVNGAHNLKGLVEFKKLDGITKTSASKSIDAVIDVMHKTFETTKKGDAKKKTATEYNFENYMRRVIKGGTACIKNMSKVAKSKGTSAELITRVQHISKECHTIMNVLLNDYMEVVKDAKLLMHQVVQSLEKGFNFKNGGRSSGSKDSGSGNPIVSVQHFRDSVAKKDAFAVRSIMADMVRRQKGNKGVLEEAIKYAEDHGVSVWEDHNGREATTKWNSLEEEYNFEKETMVGNFSKIRFDRVLKLYGQLKGR